MNELDSKEWQAKVTNWLKRNKIKFEVDENNYSTEIKLDYYLNIKFDHKEFRGLRGCLYPTSRAEGQPCYVKVLDGRKWTDEFISWAKENGVYEFNGYHCAQWGTWKFGRFTSMREFGKLIRKLLTYKEK